MGRQSRKRADGTSTGATRAERADGTSTGATRAERDDGTSTGATRAERDAARRERAERQAAPRKRAVPAPRARRAGRPSPAERPPAPWGSFPLSELVILLGIMVMVWGISSGEAGQKRIAAGLVLGSLGGGELALREHLAGYRSHSTLLAGAATFAVVTVAVVGFGPVRVWTIALIGVVVFAASLYGLVELFKRRSGGLGFRA